MTLRVWGIFLSFCFLSVQLAAAQVRQITGKVTNAETHEAAALLRDLAARGFALHFFVEVLDRALQKELPQRYRRAGEFAQDMRACIQSLAA